MRRERGSRHTQKRESSNGNCILIITEDGGKKVTAPQAAGYEFQSGGVVEMLENLRDKSTVGKTEAEHG